MYKCVTAGRPWIPIRILHGSYVSTADPKCEYCIGNMYKCVPADQQFQYFIGNMCKCVWDLKYVQIFYGSPMDPYKDLKHVNSSLEIYVNVLQRAVHGSL